MDLERINASIVEATNAFAFQVFSQVSKHHKNQNIFICPLSLTFSLALLCNGSAGETQQELTEVLGVQNIGIENANISYASLIERLGQDNGKIHLSMANSLWSQAGFSFGEAFVKRIKNFYSAEIFNLDFTDSDACSIVNNWAKNSTNGKINEIISSEDLNANIRLILISAVYFKGNWKYKFIKDNTKEVNFSLSGGNSKIHPMMTRTGVYKYLQGANFQAISIPYTDDNINMIIYLPDEQQSLSQFQEELNVQEWQRWGSLFSPTQGYLGLPRFKVTYEDSLIETFKALGMKIAFSSHANYQKLCHDNISVNDVRHKVFVEVNEEGTEAAATTSILMQRTIAQNFNMIIDRPFFFIIQDIKTELILFLGSVWEPS